MLYRPVAFHQSADSDQVWANSSPMGLITTGLNPNGVR